MVPLVAMIVICGCPVSPDDIDDDKPEPSPVAVDSLKVLVWEESSVRQDLPREQATMLGSASFREKVESKGGQFLVLDPDADVTKADQWIQESKSLSRDSLPWLMILHPSGAWIGPLPTKQLEVLGLIDGVIPKPEPPPRVHKRGCN